MGVISIKPAEDDWGAASRMIYSIITFCIGQVGPKDYLTHFKNQFDWGYNAIYLFEIETEELIEFEELLKIYITLKAYSGLGYDENYIVTSLVDLLQRVEAYAQHRKLN